MVKIECESVVPRQWTLGPRRAADAFDCRRSCGSGTGAD